jgi:radical SAM superfamily enzyme YgiQ (UPF0313 family)
MVASMKILLVQPAPFEPGRIGLENSLWLSEPVALTSLAAMVPDHEVRILDMRLEPDLVLNRTLLELRPDLVGVTSMTTDCYQARAILGVVRGTLGRACFTIIGGHHPTMCADEFEHDAIDAVVIGEGEHTFRELVDHLAADKPRDALDHIAGLRFRTSDGTYRLTAKRAQTTALDDLPAPARHLIPKHYRNRYFFCLASPMASMFTSRGCSFDCNFCAIWEFYERRTRFMSARVICDRLETIPEKFVFLLDDNFLTSKKRLEELCDEIERRKIDKYLLVQGRTDFIAENPALMRRLRDCGLMMVLSGYESNDDDSLAALRKKSTHDKNTRAMAILSELGIISTGIFMARPDFEERDFELLWKTMNELAVNIPLLTILTPLPGTELWKRTRGDLLTHDVRFFDLLHAVLPTKIPRAKFYEIFARHNRATTVATRQGALNMVLRRPKLVLRALPGFFRFKTRTQRYRPIYESPESQLRDELGTIDAAVRAAPAPAPAPAPVADVPNVVRLPVIGGAR